MQIKDMKVGDLAQSVKSSANIKCIKKSLKHEPKQWLMLELIHEDESVVVTIPSNDEFCLKEVKLIKDEITNY